MNWTFVRPVSTFTLILALATSCLAADGSLSPGDLDSRIDQVIFRTISIGAPLYNQGDPAGCYRLYQGALIAIEPMLGHRAALRQEVAKGLKDVESLATYAQRATELRRILLEIRVLNAAVRTSPEPDSRRRQPAALVAHPGSGASRRSRRSSTTSSRWRPATPRSISPAAAGIRSTPRQSPTSRNSWSSSSAPSPADR